MHPKNKPEYNNLSSTGTQEAVARAREESGDALNIVVIKADNNYDVSKLEGTKITKVTFMLYHGHKAGEIGISYNVFPRNLFLKIHFIGSFCYKIVIQ